MADSTQGNGPPKGSQGNGAPGDADEKKYITEEQLSESVNRIFTARMKDFDKKFEKTMGDVVGTIASKLDESLNTKLEALKPAPAPDKDAKAKEQEIQAHPLFAGMRKELNDMQARAKAADEATAAEKGKARNMALRSSLADQLTKAGVDPSRVKHAVGFLADAEKRVRYSADDSDDLVFRGDDNQEVDITSGVKSWLKGDDAKIYLPPRGTNGSGARPAGNTQTAQGQAPAIGERLASFFSTE